MPGWDNTTIRQIRECAKRGLDAADIAAVLGVTPRVMDRWLADPDGGPALAFAEGRAVIKRRILKRQIDLALKGDRALLIHLGRTVCGQKADDDKAARFKKEDNKNLNQLLAEIDGPGDE